MAINFLMYAYDIVQNYIILLLNVAKASQSTTTSTAITYETIANSHSQSVMIDGPLLGSLIGISIAIIIMSLVSIMIVVIVIFKRRG